MRPQAAPQLAWPEGAVVPLSPRCCLHERWPCVLALVPGTRDTPAGRLCPQQGRCSKPWGQEAPEAEPSAGPSTEGRLVCQWPVTRSPTQLSQHSSVPAPSGSLKLPCRFYLISCSFSFVFPLFLTSHIVLRVSVNTCQCGMHCRQPFVLALVLGNWFPASRPSLTTAPLPISVTGTSGEAGANSCRLPPGDLISSAREQGHPCQVTPPSKVC